MARFVVMTVEGFKHFSADSKFSEEDAKEMADFIARCQSGAIESTSALEFGTDSGVTYIMPQRITWLARVEG
jgi:hypothetical protein